MCDVIDRIYDEVESRERVRVAADMLRENMPIFMIEKISKLPETEIRSIAQNIGVSVA